jgi:hypothetical protein
MTVLEMTRAAPGVRMVPVVAEETRGREGALVRVEAPEPTALAGRPGQVVAACATSCA